MIARARLATPRDPYGILIEPNADALATAAQRDHAAALESVTIGDQSAAALRTQLRRQLGLSGPLIVTGHQPEFFHAGVFAKSVAIHALAERVAGAAVFLVTDADLPKQLALIAPRAIGAETRLERAPLPGVDANLPIELQPRSPRSEWLPLFTRLGQLLSDYEQRLMPTFTGAWLTHSNDAVALGPALSAGRRAVEAALGLGGIRELRLSELAQTSVFRTFVAHWISNAERFAAAYNDALAAYRARYRVHNPQRPVPPLMRDGTRVEVPFWVLSPKHRRARLMVAAHSDGIRLWAGDEAMGLAPPGEVAHWLLDAAQWQIRPRALTLTAFVRLFLADVFIHGIGGAKYDEVTNSFAEAVFGAPLPPIGCVTATLYLDLPRTSATVESLRAARHAVRDIRFNPQRHLDLDPEQLARRAALIAESQRLRHEAPRDRAARRRAFRAIRDYNAEIVAGASGTLAELEDRVTEIEAELRRNALANDREYFFALHRRSDLIELVGRLRTAFGVDDAAG